VETQNGGNINFYLIINNKARRYFPMKQLFGIEMHIVLESAKNYTNRGEIIVEILRASNRLS
jgi:hypothetical protein